MRHDFAPPPPPLPEFMDEAHYLSDFIVRWKLKLQGIEDKQIGVINAQFLEQWGKHRKILYKNSWKAKPYVIDGIIAFVDDVVVDWFCLLIGTGLEHGVIDEDRMLTLEKFWQKLNDIPGDKWEIKY